MSWETDFGDSAIETTNITTAVKQSMEVRKTLRFQLVMNYRKLKSHEKSQSQHDSKTSLRKRQQPTFILIQKAAVYFAQQSRAFRKIIEAANATTTINRKKKFRPEQAKTIGAYKDNNEKRQASCVLRSRLKLLYRVLSRGAVTQNCRTW